MPVLPVAGVRCRGLALLFSPALLAGVGDRDVSHSQPLRWPWLPVPSARMKWPTWCCCVEGAGIKVTKKKGRKRRKVAVLCFAQHTGSRGHGQPCWHLLVPA